MKYKIFTLLVNLFIITDAFSSLHLFSTDSYEQILNEKKPSFILVLWSLDCPPCLKELNMLSEFKKHNKALNIVLVSTDGASRSQEINSTIDQYGLTENENWVFEEGSGQALRYGIDPFWYGELPRSYLFTKDKSRLAISGTLKKQALTNWLKNTEHFNQPKI